MLSRLEPILRARSPGRPGLRWLILAAGLAAGALAPPALADSTMVSDARNARANKFDIQAAFATHRSERLYHVVRTFEAWRSRDLRSTDDRPRAICIYIWRAESDPKGRQDYEVCAGWASGRLRGVVFRPRNGQVTGRVTLRRVSSRSLGLAFDRAAIGSPLAYRWQAVTGYTGRGCPKDPPFQFGCDDSAPTRQTANHELPVQPLPSFPPDRPLPSPPPAPGITAVAVGGPLGL